MPDEPMVTVLGTCVFFALLFLGPVVWLHARAKRRLGKSTEEWHVHGGALTAAPSWRWVWRVDETSELPWPPTPGERIRAQPPQASNHLFVPASYDVALRAAMADERSHLTGQRFAF